MLARSERIESGLALRRSKVPKFSHPDRDVRRETAVICATPSLLDQPIARTLSIPTDQIGLQSAARQGGEATVEERSSGHCVESGR